MTSCSRVASATPLVRALWLLSASACFVDAPEADGDSPSGSSSSTGAIDTTSSTRPTSSDDAATMTDAIDSSGSETSTTESSAADSSSTGDQPAQCGCPPANVFCDGFETFPGPWSMPSGGGGTESQDLEAPFCDVASARLEVVETDHYAVLVGAVDATAQAVLPMPHSLRTFVHAEPGCAGQLGFARILELQIVQANGLHWYRWTVAIAGGQLSLTASNHNTPQSWFGNAALPDEWIELRLDVDFATEPPSAAVVLDGDTVVESGADAPPILEEAYVEATPPAIVLGPFFFDQPFIVPCTVRYDDVSFAP